MDNECFKVIKHNYILIGSFISLVWTSDPIVPALTAGVLDRKAGLYVVNTLILSSASPAHVHSRPESYLTQKVPTCSSTKERGGFWDGQGLLFGQAYPYKREFIDPVAEQSLRQTVTVQQSSKGGRKFPAFLLKAAAFVGEGRMAGQDNTLLTEITECCFSAVSL